MNRRRTKWALIFTAIAILLVGQAESQAATLSLHVPDGPADESVIGAIGFEDVENVASFHLVLSFASGTVLDCYLLNDTSKFVRNADFFQELQIGAQDVNFPEAVNKKKIHFVGLVPGPAAGPVQIGNIIFDITAAAEVDDTHVVTLSGQVYTEEGTVVDLLPISKLFTVIEAGTATDTDNDGLTDDLENGTCTAADDADTDDDGISDGDEDANKNGATDFNETNPCKKDTDQDGLLDGTEKGYTHAMVTLDTDLSVFKADTDPSTQTDPLDADTDDDGVPDGLEDINRDGDVDDDEIDPNDIDSDDDLIQDGTELGYTLDNVGPDTNLAIFQPDQDDTTTTDPLDDDTDNDGKLDGEEDANQNGRVDEGETDPNEKDQASDGLFFPIQTKDGKTIIIYLE